MKTLCKRARNWVQVYTPDGIVRVCGWLGEDGKFGSLLDKSLPELYHSEKAVKLRERLANQDYSRCNADSCPYLMTGEIKDIQTELGEVPEYPEELRLAFEFECNYRCTGCTVCRLGKEKTREEIEHNYDIIESRLREVLPYIKNIGANGYGELFCSKRILKLLSEWKPLAPADECEVWLETNGSLFDEEHWKQIENLGDYYLGVTLTVMSFDELTYQRLSGVKYPIEKIENNLRFVKSLREKNIINHLILGTVVQAENFRTLPEFTRRCLEEFGADKVRLRPYANWGAQNQIEEFFMDIRNKRHPWHLEYKEMLKDPIFKDPRVLEQSGGTDVTRHRAVPYELSHLKWGIMTYIMEHSDEVVKDIPTGKDIIIYGYGNIAKVLVQIMKQNGITPVYIMDQHKSGEFLGVPIVRLDEFEEADRKMYSIIVTPIGDVSHIRKKLMEESILGDIIPVWELVRNKEMKERLEYINKF